MKKKLHIQPYIVIGGLLAVVPAVQYVVRQLGSSPWNSFVYFYGIGLPIYVSCCWLLLQTKAVKLKNKQDRYFLTLMTVGVILFVIIHAIWTWASIHTFYKGV